MIFNSLPVECAHGLAQRGTGAEKSNPVDKIIDVVESAEKTALFVDDQFRQGRRVGADDRLSARHRLADRVAETFEPRGKKENIACVVEQRQILHRRSVLSDDVTRAKIAVGS